jgi:hypothetical protein
MDEWLKNARDKIAATAGLPTSELELTEAASTTLLKLAAIAAHDSGDRRNAPLLCYLIGRADGGGDLQRLTESLEPPPSDALTA